MAGVRLTGAAALLLAALLAGCGGNATSSNPWCSGCQFVYVTTVNGPVAEAKFNFNTGLGSVALTQGPAHSNGIAVDWQLQYSYLYVADPANNAVRVYRINSKDGSLAPAAVGPYSLAQASGTPQQMEIYGSDLYVASSGGFIFVFHINADGSLNSITGSPFAAGAGTSHLCRLGNQGGSWLFTADTQDPNGAISAFKIDPTAGGLAPVAGSPFATVTGGEPEDLLCTGNSLYVALHGANAVGAYAVSSSGALKPRPDSPVAAGAGVNALAGGGQFLYVENSTDGTISGFAIDATSGDLTPLAGSPFPADRASGEFFSSPAGLLLPLAGSAGYLAFDISKSGVLTAQPSPIPFGAAPLVGTILQLPVIDPAEN